VRFPLVFLLIPLLLSTSKAGPISGFGAEGGLNLTYQNWDYKSNESFGAIDFMNDWDNHFNAGVFIQFLDCKYFNLDADITYNQKGGLTKNGIQSTGSGDNGEIVLGPMLEIWDRIDYISFAPRAKFKYPMGKFDPFFSIGPSFDFLVKKSTSEIPPFDDFKKYEVSALYGVGVGYKIGRHLNCFFEFLHQPGISFIYSNSNVDIKNDVLKFNVGLLYQL
jgi:Outer membrane protein beta-barrel domain